MAFTTTRDRRADRWRTVRGLLAATIAVSVFQLFCATGSIAQVKAPSKSQLRAAPKPAVEDTQADQLNAKWLSEHNHAEATGKPPVAAPGPEDERFSGAPAAQSVNAASRSVMQGSVKLIKAVSPDAAFSSLPGGNQPASKELTQIFAGFSANAGKFEFFQGQTADGTTRLLHASLSDGKDKQSYWWFSPPDQPEGWFDDQGKRLGGTALAEPRPDARISSPFGRRTYYGRKTSTAFHNGIDYEGKTGEPIYAAADGVINHQGFYYNYGRTVKVSHADNFETLYAHMSRFADGLGQGSQVRRGDVIGYVGSTGRSTGPHLHFSTIVDGVFVDPALYMSGAGIDSTLNAGSLVAFRKWQQDVRSATGTRKADRERSRNLQGADSWGQNPFSANNVNRL